jgi:cellulase/cellobiase CelA1
VTVTYTLEHTWDGHFQGEFTLVNSGSTAISGWELTVTLPGDTVEWAWDASWHMNGDELIMDPSSDQATIGAGATITEHVMAQGSTTSPTSCTFNGLTC